VTNSEVGMDRNIYFRKMEETANTIAPVIMDSFEYLKNENPELYRSVTALPKKRLEKGTILRPFLLRCSYGVVGNESESDDWIYPAAANELFNISTYTANKILEGEKDKSEIKRELITNIIQRELASKILRNGCDESKYKDIEGLIGDTALNGYSEFYRELDLEYNDSYNNFKDSLERYLDRCYNFSGKFLENISKSGGILADADDEQIKNLAKYGKDLGLIVQIMNDVGDFVPPETGAFDIEKGYQDQYKDITSGKLTYPVLWVLEYGNKDDRKIIDNVIGNKEAKPEQLLNLTEMLVKSGAIDATKNLAKGYAREANSHLDIFEKTEHRNSLKIMTQVCRTTKYLRALYEYRDDQTVNNDHLIESILEV